MSLHSFDPVVAARVGVNAAVIYQNILFWCEKNKANSRHIRDGCVWTYNSRRAFTDLFPYFTESQIKTAIGKLTEEGLVIKGDYNLANYDKTSWYSPAVSAHWLNSFIGQKSPMDWSKIANGLDKNRQPIPDSKPDSKPDGKLEIDNAGATAKAVKPQKARIPEDWVPTDEDMEYAYSLKLTENEIKEIADDFHAYWADRTDAGGKKSSRGWQQTWRNRVRDQAPRYIRNRGMAGQARSGGYGQGGGFAGAYARRWGQPND